MERKILRPKPPGRKLVDLQSPLPTEQTETAVVPYHEQPTSPQEEAQEPPTIAFAEYEEAKGQIQPPPPSETDSQAVATPAPPLPSIRHPPPEQISGISINTMSEARDKGKEAIRVPGVPPDLEAQWAKLFVENIQQKATIRDQEAIITSQSAIIQAGSDDLKELRAKSAQSTPRLATLEMAVSDTASQISHLESEVQHDASRIAAAKQERDHAQRQVTLLRQLNATLLNQRWEEGKRTTNAEAELARVKLELDRTVEERIRSAILEAENTKLRADLAQGMEQIRLLVQSQHELSSDLNEEDRRAAEEAGEAKDEAWQGGENLGALDIEFDDDSIWEEYDADPHLHPVSSADAEVGVDVASAAIQTSAAPSLPTPLFILASTAPEAETALQATEVATAKATSCHSTGTSTDDQGVILPTDIISVKDDKTIRTSILRWLLLLLVAFLFVLQADRLAAERKVWAMANDDVRVLTAGWNGRERWSGSVGEWIEWQLETWSGVERGLLG